MQSTPPAATRHCLAAVLFLALALLLAVCAGPALARDWPRPAGPVGDYAHVVPPEAARKITALTEELWQKAKVAVVVATLPSLEGQPLEETAVDLYRAWGIGEKATSKGALILVAVGEKKLRIEVGYGLEGALTDAKSAQIRDQILVPNLRKGDYGQGLYLGVAAIAQLAAAEAGVTLTGVPEVRLKQTSRGSGGWGGLGLLVVIVVVFIVLRAMRGGGGRGGGGGGFWTGLFLGSMMGGGRRGGGDFDSFGGGFGGFGGGESGGGGASGDFGGGDSGGGGGDD